MERRDNIGTVHTRANGPIYREDAIDIARTDTDGYATSAAARDRVRWGPIWAGLMTTLSLFLLLTLLMYGIGAQRLTAGGGVGLNNTNTWITALVALVSFFAGGWVATSTALVRGTGAGLLNGFLVWALGIVLILALSSLGVGMVFGAAGNIFDQLITVQRGQINVPNINVPPVGDAIQNGALWGFFSLALSAGAAMVGGLLGSRGRPLGRVPATTLTPAHT